LKKRPISTENLRTKPARFRLREAGFAFSVEGGASGLPVIERADNAPIPNWGQKGSQVVLQGTDKKEKSR